MVQWNFYSDVLPFIAIVASESACVGSNTLFKAASSQGLSFYVFTVYVYAINTVILLPIAFFFGRKTKVSSSKFALFWRICLLGLLCLLAVMLALKAIEYSSPTLAAALGNLTPAFTFIAAIIFRMERLALRSSSFQAKFIGTIVSISGALVVVLYKGPIILSSSSPKPTDSLLWASQMNWVIGGLLLVVHCLLHSLWYIIMTHVMKMYPDELAVSFFHALSVTVFSLPICLISERNWNAWKPTSRAALALFAYSAFFGPAILSVVNIWSLRLKGPVYVATFKPLSIAIAVVMGVIFLGDSLHLGSVIGSSILSAGVYAGIWGRAREEKGRKECSCSSLASPDGRIPLLQCEEIQGV